jgi:ubiquinone/menaquinone biosynthesis C-methylase UbiE
MMFDEQRLIAKQRFRSRDLSELELRAGSLPPLIDKFIQAGRTPGVLEVGFGFGTVLVQLEKAYGSKIVLHGINKTEDHGDWNVILWNARRLGLISESTSESFRHPNLHFCDVSEGLPFEDESFDIVFSQTSFYLFREKAFFLEEVSRILRPGGIGRIDVSPLCNSNLPVQYATLLEIWKDGREIKFWDYIALFPQFKKRMRPRGDYYLEIRHAEERDIRLKLAGSLWLPSICEDWSGTKSIYSVM